MLRHPREDPPPKHQHGYAKEFQLVGSISQTQQTWNYTLVGVDSPVFWVLAGRQDDLRTSTMLQWHIQKSPMEGVLKTGK
ncbi:hypothetical protein J6590_045076 [Homalodisca vitripennis]|nr:hypothetical protein J6590_045076 [Homalodisca vitripennis]